MTLVNTSFKADTENITTLLGRNSFPSEKARPVVVPHFQRPYSWEQSHVSVFWDDVKTFHEQLNLRDSQQTYFLGPIVILPENTRVVLLDGQQRLATATILLAVIRDIASSMEEKGANNLARDIQRDYIQIDDDGNDFALKLGELDDPFFTKLIKKEEPDTSLKPKIRSHRLIYQARMFFRDRIQEISDTKKPRDFIEFLKGLQRTVSSQLKLVTIRVNSEDEAYMIFETLNDRGLRLAVPDLVLNYLMRSANNNNERKLIRQDWNGMVESLGNYKLSTYIRHYWVSHYGDVKAQALFRVIKNTISDEGLSSTDFAQSCATECEKYVSLINVVNKELGKDAVPYVQAIVDNLESERALPLLLAGIVCLNANDFAKLTRHVVTVITRYAIFANLNPNNLEDALYKAAHEIRSKNRAKKASKECLNAAKTILQKINPNKEQIESKIDEVFLSRKQALYIVYALASKAQSLTNAFSLNSNSIEHIFPENAEKMEWPEANKLEPYVWHLGNLTVLEPSLNRAAGNKPFKKKKPILAKSQLKMSREVAANYSKWNVDSITDRSRKLLSLISQVWPEKL